MGSLRRMLIALLLTVLASFVHGAFVEFDNCLDEAYITSEPRLLQFVPLNVTASFNSSGAQSTLNVTVYGNVTGQLYNGTYPSADDPSWSNPNNTFGKIVDLEEGANKYTTLFGTLNVLNYVPYTTEAMRFCNQTVGEECPLAPAFSLNSTDISGLPAYMFSGNLDGSYAFSTIEANSRIQSGSQSAQYYACVNAYITPALGDSLSDLITYLPVGILVVVGIATILAAMLSPWGTVDIFRWSSNYGRDEDVLRLVTPGFSDCLQYIQFVVFTGSLTLQYPGFYQPVVSHLGWSTLLFNESLVTGGNGTVAVVDGIHQYRPNSKRGLDRMIQLIGMTSSSDAWADMMVWLVIIMAAVVVITQIAFLCQWIYRQVKDVAPEDLRSKNWYFSVGNVVRLALGFFLLPLIALSMYQFVIASSGPTYAVALAAIVLVFIIAFAAWLTLQFVRIRPRSFLFDDLQTVLLYGPLYNTYRDDAATFALIPILVNLIRGIAVGAVQDSGVAQIILLAISEVIFILAINAIRPYPSATSMNLYHTCFSSIRLLTVMLSIAFVPSLNVSNASRGWIGYIILLIHACVLVFGFFLNAIQTLVEVIARLAGAGATGGNDAARGGLVKVFGMRQLSRRRARRDTSHRSSMGSNAQMLMTPDEKELAMARTRSRSISASSNFLLDGNRRQRTSQPMDSPSQGRQTPDGMSTISRLSKTLSSPGAIVGLKHEPKDPYYRPPRRNTNDFMTASGRPRLSSGSQKEVAVAEQAIDDAGEGSSNNRGEREENDEIGTGLTKTKTDYATREVDFYYGVRGPALSGSGGTRRMKTGPADPTGRMTGARGWFKGMLGGKIKDKGKGFEVVRSAKAPPGLFPPPADPAAPAKAIDEPYTDEDGAAAVVSSPPQKERSRTVDDGASVSTAGESWISPIPKAPSKAPQLAAIDTVGGIELPSRIGSEASRKRPRPVDEDLPPVPPVPRRSSRRGSSPASRPDENETPRLPPIAARATESPSRSNRDSQYTSSGQHRLPFARTSSNRQSKRNSAAVSEVSSYMDEPVIEDEPPMPLPQTVERPGSVGYVNQHRASDNIGYSPDEAQIPRLSTVEYGYSHQNTHPQHEQVSTPETPWSPAWNGSSAYPQDGTQRWSRFRD